MSLYLYSKVILTTSTKGCSCCAVLRFFLCVYINNVNYEQEVTGYGQTTIFFQLQTNNKQMMKQKHLLKSLLVAAGLCVGASAWADDVASYDFNDQTSPFVISDGARLSASYALQSESDYYAKYSCGNMNGVAFAYYDFTSSVSDAETVTVDFDFYIVNVAGHALISIADASSHTASGGGFTAKSNTGYGTTGAIFRVSCKTLC